MSGRRAQGRPAEECSKLSRRELVARGAVVGGAALFAGPQRVRRLRRAAARRATRSPWWAPVSAGLTCAYRLRPARRAAPQLYEARSDRVGGRFWTAHEFGPEQVGEHGGEFIDSDHRPDAGPRPRTRAFGSRIASPGRRRRSRAYSRLYLDGELRDWDVVYRDFPDSEASPASRPPGAPATSTRLRAPRLARFRRLGPPPCLAGRTPTCPAAAIRCWDGRCASTCPRSSAWMPGV